MMPHKTDVVAGKTFAIITFCILENFMIYVSVASFFISTNIFIPNHALKQELLYVQQ